MTRLVEWIKREFSGKRMGRWPRRNGCWIRYPALGSDASQMPLFRRRPELREPVYS
jgi:hypothetical protein